MARGIFGQVSPKTSAEGIVKKKKKQMELLDAETEEMAYMLTLLVVAIAPAVDKAATYELIYELLGEGMGEDTMEVYGALIRATAFGDKQEVH